MAKRYAITQRQLDELFNYAESGEEKYIKIIIKQIKNEQFIEDSDKYLIKDIKKYKSINKLYESINILYKLFRSIKWKYQ